MRTNIDIDDALMAEAMEATGSKTKRETVEKALNALIMRQRQLGMLDLFGKIEWVGDLDEMRTDKPDSPWLS
jgi:Arc/MetJ family transcription regulator